MLFGLSQYRLAPARFGQLSKAALQYFVPNTMELFTLASALCVILFISIWALIMCCYLRYYKTQPHLHQASKFKMPKHWLFWLLPTCSS